MQGSGEKASAVVTNDGDLLPEQIPERIALVLSEVTILAMMTIIVVEVLLRKFLHFSLDAADELGGYFLVAVAFFSLSVCQARGAFHRVELLQGCLSPRGRALLLLVFDLLSLIFILILVWQLGRLVRISWNSGETSMSSLLNTYLTPLWIPRLTMPIGAAVLCYTLSRAIFARLHFIVFARPSQ